MKSKEMKKLVVEIAKDCLKMIQSKRKNRKFLPSHSTYLDIDFDFDFEWNDVTAKDILTSKKEVGKEVECRACAIGSLFIAHVC